MVQDRDAVGEAEHDVHVVLDHRDRHPRVADLADDLGQAVDVLCRHPGHRLVEEQHRRLGGEGHRELELATVAVREVTSERRAPDPAYAPG